MQASHAAKDPDHRGSRNWLRCSRRGSRRLRPSAPTRRRHTGGHRRHECGAERLETLDVPCFGGGQPLDEVTDISADVWRPGAGKLTKPVVVPCVKGAARFLEVRRVPCKCGHDPVSRIAGLSDAVRSSASSFVYETAQRCGGSARLLRQPFPVAWKEGDFARRHAEPRSSTWWPRGRLRGDRDCAVCAQIDQAAGCVIEDK